MKDNRKNQLMHLGFTRLRMSFHVIGNYGSDGSGRR